MRNGLSRWVTVTLVMVPVLALATIAAAGQARAYRAPRTADGKPNISGIWQAINEANWDIEGHGAAPGPYWQLGAEFSVPPGLGVVEGGPLPYTPEALQQKTA